MYLPFVLARAELRSHHFCSPVDVDDRDASVDNVIVSMISFVHDVTKLLKYEFHLFIALIFELVLTVTL